MTEKQPAALRLASELHAGKFVSNMTQNEGALRTASAEMLVRQHARITELEAQLEAIDVDWQDAAKKIAIRIAGNCGTVPQLVFPHLYLGLKELFDKPAQCLQQSVEPHQGHAERLIVELYENGDPVSIDAAEELKRLLLQQRSAEDTARLDWLEADVGKRVFHLGEAWYIRTNYGQPYRKQKSLREAIDAAITAQAEKGDVE